MTEIPLFVPCGNEHIAVILDLPASTARGLVLLLPGLGIRSHRDRVWTWAARGLAERGIAAARMDYLGIGDSTGVAHGATSPADQVATVVEVLKRATGAEHLGLVGHCRGAHTALELTARLPGHTSVVCVLPAPVRVGRGGLEATQLAPAAQSVAGTASRWLRSLRRRAKRGQRAGFRSRLGAAVPPGVRAADVLFLMLGGWRRAEPLGREAAALSSAHAANGARFSVRALHIEDIWGFRVPESVQPGVINAIAEWMEATL